MTLVAKPLIKNQRWIVLDSGNKVGAVEATKNGYRVQLGNLERCYDSTSNIENFVKIKFERPEPAQNLSVSHNPWPTTGSTYNNILDIKRKLHLYTKEPDSKCYYASGWFKINFGDAWETHYCPKYIYVTRYEYRGPFMTQLEAIQA